MRKVKKIKIKKEKTSNSKNIKNSGNFKPWIKKSLKYSSYPYLLVISCFRRNVFFNLTNYKGQTKYWTCSGQFGFRGKTKVARMALITVTENFIKRIWEGGARNIILVFKNYNRRHTAMTRGIKLALKKNYLVKFVSLTIKTQIIFNGCRRKKKRRR